MRSRRSAALLAVATAALTAVPAALAHADGAAPTSLSIREARQVILPGQHDRISGQLRANGAGPITGATVQLLRRPAGTQQWTAARSKSTDSNGVVTFLVSPRRTVQFELAYAGDATHQPTRSGVVTTRVSHKLPTAIAIAVDKHSVTPGDSDVVSGRLHLARPSGSRRGLSGETVTLKSKAPGTKTWSDVATGTTGHFGVVSFTVTPAQTTRYAIFFAGTQQLRASRSRGRTVFVGQPTALSIAASATSVDSGQSASISGVLTSNSQPVSGATVELRARPAGASQPSTVATGSTGPDGSVTFSVTPATTTTYRLRFPATSTLTPSVSAPVTVFVRRPTSLSIRLTGDTVAGTLLAQGGRQLSGRTVTLQSRAAGSSDPWTAAATATTGQHGYVAFTVNPTSSTDYRLDFAPTARFQGCDSGIVTDTVS